MPDACYFMLSACYPHCSTHARRMNKQCPKNQDPRTGNQRPETGIQRETGSGGPTAEQKEEGEEDGAPENEQRGKQREEDSEADEDEMHGMKKTRKAGPVPDRYHRNIAP